MRLSDIQPSKKIQDIYSKRRAMLSEIVALGMLTNMNSEMIRACPVCKSKSSNDFLTNTVVTFVRCTECGLIFQRRKIKDEIRLELFRNSEYFNMSTQNIQMETYDSRKYDKFGPILERLTKIIPPDMPVDLLDVGCSAGYFLDLTRERTAWQGIGVEPNQIAVSHGLKKGLRVECQDIMDADFEDSSFDIITAFGLIGRLSDPVGFVAKCFKLLRLGGYLALTTANCSGFEFAVCGCVHTYFDPLDTICGFNIENITRLIEQCSLKIVQVSTPGKFDIEIVKRYIQDYDIEINLNPFEEDLLFSDRAGMEETRKDFVHFLNRNKMSGLMEIVAKKDNTGRFPCTKNI